MCGTRYQDKYLVCIPGTWVHLVRLQLVSGTRYVCRHAAWYQVCVSSCGRGAAVGMYLLVLRTRYVLRTNCCMVVGDFVYSPRERDTAYRGTWYTAPAATSAVCNLQSATGVFYRYLQRLLTIPTWLLRCWSLIARPWSLGGLYNAPPYLLRLPNTASSSDVADSSSPRWCVHGVQGTGYRVQWAQGTEGTGYRYSSLTWCRRGCECSRT